MDKIETWGRGQKHQTLEVQRIPKDKLDLRVEQAAILLSVRADSVTASGPTESEDTQCDYSQLDTRSTRMHRAQVPSFSFEDVKKVKQTKPLTQNSNNHHVSKQFWLPLGPVFKAF